MLGCGECGTIKPDGGVFYDSGKILPGAKFFSGSLLTALLPELYCFADQEGV